MSQLVPSDPGAERRRAPWSRARPKAPADAARTGQAASVFISYSRKDGAFVDRLDQDLRQRGIEPLVDRQEIYAFEDWWARIQGLIAQADTILFVLSPDAVDSDICRKEVAFAETLNKRFAPVVARAVAASAIPSALERLNFIFLDDPETYPARIDRLVEALETDIGWVRAHSGYCETARLWTEAGRPRAHLLAGRQLEEAERWIARRPAGAPVPTEDVQALLVASRRAASRRRRLTVTSLGLGLVFALGLASVAVWQRQVAVANEQLANRQTALASEREHEATRERDRARRALANAKSAADGLIFDLAQGLRDRGLPVAIVQAVLERAETLMTRLVDSAPDDPDLLRSQFAMYAEFAQTYASAGATDRRKDAAARALAISRRLAGRDPSSADAARDVFVSLMKVGDAQMAVGDLSGALASYEECLANARRIAARNPSDADAAADVSASLEKIGDVQLARGDLVGALASHEESLAIARRLAERNPSDAAVARNLWVSLNKVGDIQAAHGDLTAALASYDQALVIARRRVALDPSNAEASADLSLSLEQVGDVSMTRGNLVGALASYDESLAIRRRLATQDPSDAGAARSLSVSLNKLGDVMLASGDLARAGASYEESLAIRRRLAAQDPSNAGTLRDVTASLTRLTVVAIQRERYPEACRYLAEGRALLTPFRDRTGIAKALIDELTWFESRNAAYCGSKRAEALGDAAYGALMKGDFAGALKLSDEAIALAPDLVWLQTNRAHALMMLGRTDEARAIYLRYRGRMAQDDTSWEKEVADDFAAMRKAGMINHLMDEIEKTFAKPE